MSLKKIDNNIIELLLNNKKLNLDIKNNEGQTIVNKLFSLALNKRIELIKMLIENGANPNIPNNDGYTALDISCQNDIAQMVQLLHDNKAQHSWKYYYEKSKIKEITFIVGLGLFFYNIAKK